MATIRAFRALRPQEDKAAEIAAASYDLINSEEARETARSPISFLHVLRLLRPEIALSDDIDPYSDLVYHRASENLQKLIRDRLFFLERRPGIYAYRLRMKEHTQVGVVACCSLDEYDDDTIRRHEQTFKEKEDDRTRHALVLRAQTGPVLLTYRGRGSINKFVSVAKTKSPLYDFTSRDGVQHTLWRIDARACDRLIEEFRSVPYLYIADGHHRIASAARVRAQMRSANTSHTGEEAYNFFIAALFPADQLQILPYNRVVKHLNGVSAGEFITALAERFVVTDQASPSPKQTGEISMYLDGHWYGFKARHVNSSGNGHVASLDLNLLQQHILDPLLGIKDAHTSEHIGFVGGPDVTAMLERTVDEGHAAIAFSVCPIRVSRLMEIADKGEIMLPKSTWFEPKPCDGLLIHLLDIDSQAPSDSLENSCEQALMAL